MLFALCYTTDGIAQESKEKGKKQSGSSGKFVTEHYPDSTVNEYSMIPVNIYEDQWAVTEVENNEKDGDEVS